MIPFEKSWLGDPKIVEIFEWGRLLQKNHDDFLCSFGTVLSL